MNKSELQQAVDALTDWFHSIDLGQGVVTPGAKTSAMLETELASLRLPDLAGKSVLDIGAYDGYYTFAAERLGARRVVALDHFVWALDLSRLRTLGPISPNDLETSPAWDLRGLPGKRRFDLAHRALGSNAETVVADFLDLDSASIGGPFDVVLFLGVLYHMRNPMLALERVAQATGTMAVIETEAVELAFDRGRPLCEFVEDEMNRDFTNWWVPNQKALLGMCRSSGFSRVEVVRQESASPAGRLRHLARLRRDAGMSLTEVARRAPRRLREALRGIQRYRLTVHAWK
jgi:tRNA (mo5U34)-methyltransferase